MAPSDGAPDGRPGYTAGERLAGVLLGLLAIGLLLVAADLATGGGLTFRRRGCEGCGDA